MRVNFTGALFFLKKSGCKFQPKNSGPEFGPPKFVCQNSAPHSGFGGAKSPVQKVGLEENKDKEELSETVFGLSPNVESWMS